MRDFLTILQDLKLRLTIGDKYPETVEIYRGDLIAIGDGILTFAFAKLPKELIASRSEQLFSADDLMKLGRASLETLFGNRTTIIPGYNSIKGGLAFATYEDGSETEIKI